MLTIFNNDSPCNRRHFLSVGGLALGGLSLATRFTVQGAEPASTASPHPLARGKSVIFLFQQGGPSQFETFDPKPDAPDTIRTVTGVIPTSLPGVHFGDRLPQLAKLAHKFNIVRSFASGNAAHNIVPMVGPESHEASLGAIYSRVVGPSHPVTAMPSSAIIFPQAIDDKVTRGQGRGDLAAVGGLGPAHAPFIAGGKGPMQKNLQLNMSPDRFTHRQELLGQIDQLRQDTEAVYEHYDRIRQQSCDVLLSGRVAEALDLSREDPRTIARYDTSRFARADDWSKARRGKRGYYTGHARTLGKAILLARRLCEAGCGFVTVHTSYEGVWDMHADGENLNMRDGMDAIGYTFDHAVATFIEDVEARGLSEQIMLIATGEMGRTPRLNKNGGRDHWSRLTPLFVYGGGTTSGQVIGRSTRDGGEPDAEAFTTPNLISTIMHALFHMGEMRLQPSLNTLSLLGEPKPIPVLA